MLWKFEVKFVSEGESYDCARISFWRFHFFILFKTRTDVWKESQNTILWPVFLLKPFLNCYQSFEFSQDCFQVLMRNAIILQILKYFSELEKNMFL